jgi:hypothetical protein
MTAAAAAAAVLTCEFECHDFFKDLLTFLKTSCIF